MSRVSLGLASLLAGLALTQVRADEQEIAPGTGLQSSVVINTGPDGICNTTAAAGDIQAAPVGGGTPNRNEIHCGVDKVANSVAGGDDVQLVAVGGSCKNANTVVVDTGDNGVPETALVGDDTYVGSIALGVPPPNTPCVIAGADGVAQTAAPLGDDNQSLAAGTAAPNTAVVRCGPNLIADTAANNVAPGDDVQLVPQGGACTANQVVVDSGADGIATTRAEGPDLQLSVGKPVKINIPSGSANARKVVKFSIANVEFGPSAPASRAVKLTSTGGSCPNGTVREIDLDSSTPGLQATANVPLGGKVKGTFAVLLKLEDITTVDTKAPFRCTFDISAVALDTAPDEDDGANIENNTTTIDLEVVDKND